MVSIYQQNWFSMDFLYICSLFQAKTAHVNYPLTLGRLETELQRLSFDAYCTITNSRGEMIIDWLWSSSALWLHGNYAGFRLSKVLLKFQLEVQLCSWTRNWCTAVNSQRRGGRGKFRWVIKLLQLSWWQKKKVRISGLAFFDFYAHMQTMKV